MGRPVNSGLPEKIAIKTVCKCVSINKITQE